MKKFEPKGNITRIANPASKPFKKEKPKQSKRRGIWKIFPEKEEDNRPAFKGRTDKTQ